MRRSLARRWRRVGLALLLAAGWLAGRGCLPVLSEALPDDDDTTAGDDDTTIGDDDTTVGDDDDDTTVGDDDDSADDDDDTTGMLGPRIEIEVHGLVLDGPHVYTGDVTCEQVKDEYQIAAGDPDDDEDRITLTFEGEPIPLEIQTDDFTFAWEVDDWSVTGGGPGVKGCSLEIHVVEDAVTGRFHCQSVIAIGDEQHEELEITDGGFVCP